MHCADLTRLPDWQLFSFVHARFHSALGRNLLVEISPTRDAAGPSMCSVACVLVLPPLHKQASSKRCTRLFLTPLHTCNPRSWSWVCFRTAKPAISPKHTDQRTSFELELLPGTTGTGAMECVSTTWTVERSSRRSVQPALQWMVCEQGSGVQGVLMPGWLLGLQPALTRVRRLHDLLFSCF